ncbi:MAG: serine--tRNA ligase [Clostridia bacterium]|nr:serine--tRNA ligase [Clostridia bacterium]MBN2884047.1 serine--tRNA ligase [Clostridia bacterium]
MLDIRRIRENTEEVTKAMAKRGFVVDFQQLIEWDDERKSLIFACEQMKAEKNTVSSEIPKLKKLGEDVTKTFVKMKELSDSIKDMEASTAICQKKIQEFMEVLPNIPDEDVIPGDAAKNEVIRTWGSKPEFDFEIRNHVDLCENLGLIDYKRGTKISGNGFWLYRGDGAVLEWALLNYFIEEHLKDGYEFLLPPHILGHACGYTAGQFPKFAADVFALENDDDKDEHQFLLPTAETALINVHRDEILPEESLPRKYFAYTPCYRKEAGSYRAEERGMIRGHQFNKIEMFQYTVPEKSDEALEELVGKAEKLMQGLGLHYRTTKLAAGDVSHSMAKTYDIEVWIPSMGIYKEVSSASNARDYQARRGKIRYRKTEDGKNDFLHTLNASGLATSRIFPAIVEQFQQQDGSVLVPKVLVKWFGKEMISK